MKSDIKRYMFWGFTLSALSVLAYIIVSQKKFDGWIILEVLVSGSLYTGWLYYDECKKKE